MAIVDQTAAFYIPSGTAKYNQVFHIVKHFYVLQIITLQSNAIKLHIYFPIAFHHASVMYCSCVMMEVIVLILIQLEIISGIPL